MIAQEAEETPAPEQEAPAEPEQAPAEQPFSSTSRIDFSNLKFGKDYEIK